VSRGWQRVCDGWILPRLSTGLTCMAVKVCTKPLLTHPHPSRILELLSASQGNILDDEELIDTLAQAKVRPVGGGAAGAVEGSYAKGRFEGRRSNPLGRWAACHMDAAASGPQTHPPLRRHPSPPR
jgi:hypothetical protein